MRDDDDAALSGFLNRFRQDGTDVLYDASAVEAASRNDATRALAAFIRRHGRLEAGTHRVPASKIEGFCRRMPATPAAATERPPAPLQALRSVDVSDIDVEEARRHFDLPIDDQMDGRSIRGHLSGTKKALLALFKGKREIEVWRGMSVPDGWAEGLDAGDPLGTCWAWSEGGAMRGSGFDARSGLDDGSVLLRGRVSPDHVDWPTTIAVNAFSESENEVVLLPDAVILLDSAVGLRAGRELLGDDLRGQAFSPGEPDDAGTSPPGPS